MSNTQTPAKGRIGAIFRIGLWLIVVVAVVSIALLGAQKFQAYWRARTGSALGGEGSVSASETYQPLGNIDHGDSLEAVMEAIRDEPYEICAAFDAEGRKLYEYTDYDPLKVETSAELTWYAILNDEVVFVHNHPNDVPFSKLDLLALTTRKVPTAIVVTTTQTFTLTATNGWPETETASRYLNAMTENFAVAQSLGLIHVTSLETSGVRYVSTTKLIEEFAEKFGLEFTVTPRPDTERTRIGVGTVGSAYTASEADPVEPDWTPGQAYEVFDAGDFGEYEDYIDFGDIGDFDFSGFGDVGFGDG